MQRVMDKEKINRLIDAILVMQEREDTTTPAFRSQLAETESAIGNILTREQMTAWFEQFRHGDPASRDFQKRLIDTLA